MIEMCGAVCGKRTNSSSFLASRPAYSNRNKDMRSRDPWARGDRQLRVGRLFWKEWATGGPDQVVLSLLSSRNSKLRYPVAEWVAVKGSHAQPQSRDFQSHSLLPPTAQSHTQHHRIQGRRSVPTEGNPGNKVSQQELENCLGQPNSGILRVSSPNKNASGARSPVLYNTGWPRTHNQGETHSYATLQSAWC